MTLLARPVHLCSSSDQFESAFQARLHWAAETDAGIEDRVDEILAAVRARGPSFLLRACVRVCVCGWVCVCMRACACA